MSHKNLSCANRGRVGDMDIGNENEKKKKILTVGRVFKIHVSVSERLSSGRIAAHANRGDCTDVTEFL